MLYYIKLYIIEKSDVRFLIIKRAKLCIFVIINIYVSLLYNCPLYKIKKSFTYQLKRFDVIIIMSRILSK